MVLPGGRVVYLDVGNEATRFAAEFHGWEWHSSPDRSSTTTRASRWCESQGWLVKPVWRSNLWGPQADVDRILERGLVEARQRFGARVLHQRRH